MKFLKVKARRIPYVLLFLCGYLLVTVPMWLSYAPSYRKKSGCPEASDAVFWPTTHRPYVRKDQQKNPKEPPLITIYPWYKRSRNDIKELWFGKGVGTAAFESCAEPRCSVVNETTHSDAVLISHNYLTSYHKDITLPLRAGPHQKWIFFSWETPQHFNIKPEFVDLFNGTFTYMAKSDVHYPYGKVLPREEPVVISYDDKNWERKQPVVWVVSHCQTGGGREDYVTELAKHIDVSIYGECGNKTLPLTTDHKRTLQEEYKFYLAFENSVCSEYATEKLFQTLNTRMIPVVYGLYDYAQNLPRHSFIDVRDFKSPKHLADYLKVLANNKTQFDEYFTWKQHYVVHQNNFKSTTCQLCEYLHSTRHDPPLTVHLDAFWDREKICINKKTFLRSVGVQL